MTMTREEAEAAGWEFQKIYLSVAGDYAAGASKVAEIHILRHGHTKWHAQENLLAAITSIERYADAEKLLEECKELVKEVSTQLSHFGHVGAANETRLRNLSAKLEARK